MPVPALVKSMTDFSNVANVDDKIRSKNPADKILIDMMIAKGSLSRDYVDSIRILEDGSTHKRDADSVLKRKQAEERVK